MTNFHNARSRTRRFFFMTTFGFAMLGLVASGCNSARQSFSNGATPSGATPSGAKPQATPNLVNSVEPKTETGRAALGLRTRATWMEFATQPRQLTANGLAIWLINIWQKGKSATKARHRNADFKVARDKLIHVIAVSKDLSYFHLFHPDHKGNGHFIIEQTLPRAGDYKIFADYTPLNGQREVARRDFTVLNDATQNAPTNKPINTKFVADKFVGGFASQRVVSAPIGETSTRSGETYNVKLAASKLVAGRNSTLKFSVADAANKPLRDLQPYLGAIGNAVVLSVDLQIFVRVAAEGNGATVLDSVANLPNESLDDPRRGGPDVVFGAIFPTPGLYKIWAQFRHNNRIVTAPFVVNVVADESR